MDEINENDFKIMSENFIEIYKSKCQKFVDYFVTNYMNRPKTWAMCYRQFPHANTDTNMYVESFHNRLKTYYMKRRVNRRVDDLLIMLLEIEEDDYWRHLLDCKYERQENIQQISIRHTRGMKIKDDDVKDG